MQILEHGVSEALLHQILREPLYQFGIGRYLTRGFNASFAKNGLDESLRSNAFITMMQPTQLRDLDILSDPRDLPRNRTLLVEA